MAFQSDEQKRQLIARLDGAKDPVQRIQLLGTIKKLADAGDQTVNDLFRRLAEIDRSEAVRDFARKCLTMVAGTRAPSEPEPPAARANQPEPAPPSVAPPPPPQPGDERMAKFMAALGHEKPDMRVRAIQAAVQVGLTQALPHLTAKLATERSGTVLEALLPAIGGLDAERKHFTTLIPFLRAEDPQARAGAVLAIDTYDDERKLRLLVPLAADADSRVKGLAIQALGRVGKERLLAELQTMGSAGNRTMKDQVLAFIEQWKSEESGAVLLMMCADPEVALRKRAIGQLATRGDKRLLDLTVAWVKSATVEDLELLAEALETFDGATKGKHGTDVSILRSRISRVAAGDEAARQVDLVLSVMRVGEGGVDSPAAAAAHGRDAAQPSVARRSADTDRMLEEMAGKSTQEAKSRPERRPPPGGRAADGETFLRHFFFLTKITLFLKVGVAIGLCWYAFAYIEPVWQGYIYQARDTKMLQDFQVVARVIKVSEVGGKAFLLRSTEDMIRARQLESCQDPWGQPYLIQPEFKCILSTGPDRTYHTTAAQQALRDGTVVPRDDVRYYYSTERPSAVWIGVETAWHPELFEVSLDGASAVNITSSVSSLLFQPNLSPDGTRMAWCVKDDKGVWQIAVGSLLGALPQVLTQGDGHSRRPMWSLDGSKLLFWTKRSETNNLAKVGLVDLAGKERLLYQSMPDDDVRPAFEPGSKRFWFSRSLAGAPPCLMVYDPDWNGPRAPASSPIPGDYALPLGKGGVLFLGGQSDHDFDGVYRFVSEGTAPTAVARADHVVPPLVLSPDGTQLFYCAREASGYKVLVRDLSGAAAKAGRPEEMSLFSTPWPVSSITWRGLVRAAAQPQGLEKTDE